MSSAIALKKSTTEYGDYQTPGDFSGEVCALLRDHYRLAPTAIVEPTYGTGNFIVSTLNCFESVTQVFGVEINPLYKAIALKKISDCKKPNLVNVELYNQDIFMFDFETIKDSIKKNEELLIIGNPPWATNSELSSISSYNIPFKDNFKALGGLDAITGKGNFDIAEYIILQLLSEFRSYNCHLAMLCKSIVAKNIVRDIEKYSFNFNSVDMFTFDAMKVFDVSCDSVLLVVKLGGDNKKTCNVLEFYNPTKLIRKFGWENGLFLSHIENYRASQDFDGQCCLTWRQGIKHDCAKVMELTKRSNNEYVNGYNEILQIDDSNYIFPLLKSSDIKFFEISDTRKFVIVPQTKVNEDTSTIKEMNPPIWEYLHKHSDLLNARKSIIYKKSPSFSIFGVGDYSFLPYKVAISGFYKKPIFAFVHGVKPIMLDDTCYFLSFQKQEDALIATALLNNTLTINFLKSIAFLDSKRPFTKEILKRIDLLKVAKIIGYVGVLDFLNSNNMNSGISVRDFENFTNNLMESN